MLKHFGLKVCLVTSLALGMLGTVATSAASAQYDRRDRAQDWQIGGSLGFYSSALGRSAVSLGFTGAYYFTDNVRLMPRLSLGFDDGLTLFTLMGDVHYVFDIKSGPIGLRALKPFAGGGLGINIADTGGNTYAGFTIALAGGLDYYLTRGFSLGTEMDFMIPITLAGDNFIFQWQVVTAKYLF